MKQIFLIHLLMSLRTEDIKWGGDSFVENFRKHYKEFVLRNAEKCKVKNRKRRIPKELM
jgi:hypothetical protein